MGIDGLEQLTGNKKPQIYHLLKNEGSSLTACGRQYDKKQEERDPNERITLCRDCANGRGDLNDS